MRGIWKGYYTYNNQRIQKAGGYEKTNLTITIDSFDGKIFKGTVQDDVSTGGMEEVGLIEGHVEESKVFLKKRMPKHRQIVDKKGTRKISDEKHPTLFYSGHLSGKNTSGSGKWKFEITIGFLFGFIPIPFRPASGTWNMILQSDNS